MPICQCSRGTKSAPLRPRLITFAACCTNHARTGSSASNRLRYRASKSFSKTVFGLEPLAMKLPQTHSNLLMISIWRHLFRNFDIKQRCAQQSQDRRFTVAWSNHTDEPQIAGAFTPSRLSRGVFDVSRPKVVPATCPDAQCFAAMFSRPVVCLSLNQELI